MQIANGLRSFLVAISLVVSVAAVTPAQSMTVPVNTPFSGSSDQIFGDGDTAGYSVVLGAGDTSFYIEFQTAASGAVNFAAGNEGSGLADIDIAGVSLIDTSTNTALSPSGVPVIFSEGPGQNNPAPFSGGLHTDAFFASFAGLVSGTTYRLLVDVEVFDTSGSFFGGNFDLFNGQISFNVVPIPPALLLFATGLLGLGVLSRRRRQNSVLP